jgi:hypothetical protein
MRKAEEVTQAEANIDTIVLRNRIDKISIPYEAASGVDFSSFPALFDLWGTREVCNADASAQRLRGP